MIGYDYILFDPVICAFLGGDKDAGVYSVWLI